MPIFEPHLVQEKKNPHKQHIFVNVNANAKQGRNGLPRERKSKMRQTGLRPSQLKWQNFFKTLQGSLLRLSDSMKKDERNGYQMREKKERIICYTVFVGNSNCLSKKSEDKWEEWVSNEREERKNRRLGSWTVCYTIFVGCSNRLDDRVKTDEKNRYQMREREERTIGYSIFVGSSNRLGDGVKTDERNGYQMREREERTIG